MITVWWQERRSRALPEGGDEEITTIGRLDLDVVEQDSYDVAATITAHAVEEGTPITDHVLPLQDRATCTVLVSGRQSSTNFVVGSRAGTFELSDGTEATGIVVPEGTDRIGDVHSILRRLCREGIEVDVEGLRREIEGWLIESVSSPRTVETAGLLVCDLALVEVRYAEVEEVDAPSPRVERGRQRRDRGRQSTTETGDDTASSDPSDRREALESIAHSLVSMAGLS